MKEIMRAKEMLTTSWNKDKADKKEKKIKKCDFPKWREKYPKWKRI